MYPKHNTRAIVLRTYPLKEADRGFVLFTEKFGVMHARAIGIRKEASKLRYILSGSILVSLTLIQGKSGWRIVEVSKSEKLNSYDNLKNVGRILKLLLCMTPKEDVFISNEVFNEVFDFILRGVYEKEQTLQLAIKIMKALGYVRDVNIEEFSYEKMVELMNVAIKTSDLSVKLKW